MSEQTVTLERTAVRPERSSRARRALLGSKFSGPTAAVILAVLFPLAIGHNGYWIYIATEVALYVLVTSGLNILFGYAGEAFLGQGALIAVGAYSTGLLMVDRHWTFWLATLVSVPLVVVFGVVVALPSLRISHWYFALITLSLDALVQALLVQFGFTGGATGVLGISMPSVMGSTMTARELYWMVVALDVVVAYVLWRLVKSRYGRALQALRDGGAAAMSVGASPLRMRLLAFTVAAIVCSLGGSLFATLNTVITPDDFSLQYSVFFLVAVVVGGTGSLWGPLVGCIVFFTVPDLLHALATWQLLVYGVVLLALMLFAPKGLVGALSALWARLGPPLRRPAAVSSAITVQPRDPEGPGGSGSREPVAGTRLQVQGVNKTFGAVRALFDLELSVDSGQVFAIVGPNGSGKTTALNVISGYYRPETGKILIDGSDVVGLAPAAIARRGVARTFQTPKILGDVSVVDNVMLGTFDREQSSLAEVLTGLGRSRSEREALIEEAHALLRLCGVGGAADLDGSAVSHGQQRLVELARAMMAHARMVLLDEPAAGLGPDDMENLTRTIETFRSSGATVVIVEHHIDLVTKIADTVAVIDRGSVLAVGSPDEVFSRPDVTAAYMGSGS